jgi:hypothetical protein
MRDNNLLPYDGDVFLIEDDCAEFDWPAITRKLMDTIPWHTVSLKMGNWLIMARPDPALLAASGAEDGPRLLAPRVNLTFRHMMPSPSS